MPKTPLGLTFVCPNCHQPVDPTRSNAMKNATTQEWQHTDCWVAKPPVEPPEASKNKGRRP